jgi:putative transposase
MKGFEIKLKAKEIKLLKAIIGKGVEKARKITRCRILLLCNAGKSKTEIVSMLSINPNTVTNICRRYIEDGLDSAINEKLRPGAPTIFDGKLKAKITALACSTPPEGRSQWSLRLLSDKAVELDLVDSISHEDVRRILKKTKLSPI